MPAPMPVTPRAKRGLTQCAASRSRSELQTAAAVNNLSFSLAGLPQQDVDLSLRVLHFLILETPNLAGIKHRFSKANPHFQW